MRGRWLGELWLGTLLLLLTPPLRAEEGPVPVSLWAIQRGCEAQAELESAVRLRLSQMGEDLRDCTYPASRDLSCIGSACLRQVPSACRGRRVLGGGIEPGPQGTRIRLWLAEGGERVYERQGWCEGCVAGALADEVARQAGALLQHPQERGQVCGERFEPAATPVGRRVLLAVNVRKGGRGLGARMKAGLELLGHVVVGIKAGMECTSADCLRALAEREGRAGGTIDWVVAVEPEQKGQQDRLLVWGFDLGSEQEWHQVVECSDACPEEERQQAVVRALGQVAQRCVGAGCERERKREQSTAEQALCAPPPSLVACQPPPVAVVAPKRAPHHPQRWHRAGLTLMGLGAAGIAAAGIAHGLDQQVPSGPCRVGMDWYLECHAFTSPYYQIGYGAAGFALGMGIISFVVYRIQHE